jgi:hypothetical protein
MKSEIMNIIEAKYISAGFQSEEVENYGVFKNAFSVHYVFFLGDLNSVREKLKHAQASLERDYLQAKDVADIHWNVYSIFIFDVDASDDEFLSIKRDIESNLIISRKYVFTMNEIEALPPLYMDITREAVEEGRAWEDEWAEAVGEDLYQLIMESPKSHIDKLLKDFIDDRANKAE